MNQVFVRLFLAVAIVLGPTFANAQIKGLLRDKALKTISKKVEGEEEKQPEAQPENQQQADEPAPQRSNNQPNFLERKMMSAMGLNNVKYEKQYDFSSSMLMEIEVVDSLSNKEKVLYSTYFSPNDKSYALVFDGVDKETGKKQKSTIIFDTKNWAMLILGDDGVERNGMALYIPPDSAAMESESEEITEEVNPEEFVHPWYAPTGNSKTIAGFNCKEYSYVNPEGSVNLWVTNDQKLNFSNAYSYMNGFQALASGGWAYGMGMVMEMVFKDANSDASTHMIVKEILPESFKKLDISSYNIIGMGGQQ